jgi:hypothetical protein
VCRFRNSTLFLFFICSAAFSQVKQTVTGIVTDGVSKQLAGASIQLIRSDSSFLAVSDTAGKFNLDVNTGRYLIRASFTGYSTFEDELLVIAGKSSMIKIQLTESSTQLSDVEISSGATPEIPGNYSISIEKTMRVPANFFDPVRMATSLPGVVATNDQGNSIAIKGYSPNAMLWRLQGLDIVNPNHLANAGTLSDRPVANGGGVSILSSQVLDRTNFYSGSLPVQYGNALSGAMDMSLRPGNKTSREHTVQASLIGIDLATEGPMSKKNESGEAKASYLVNYRYSTIGLLSQMGVNFGDEVINFQDLTFNLDFKHKDGGSLSVFGFGGLSSNEFNQKPQDEWETEKDRYNIDFSGKVYGVGFLNRYRVGQKGILKSGISISGQNQERQSQGESALQYEHIISEYYKSNRSLFSGRLSIQQQVSSKTSFEAGIVATSINHELKSETEASNLAATFPEYDGSVLGVLWQPFAVATWKVGQFDMNAGLRYVYFTFNETSSLEPRAGISTLLFNGLLSFNYGITSQQQQTQTYLAAGNEKLGLNRAHQLSVGYARNVKGVSVIGNAFYHSLFNVAMAPGAIPYSVLNQMEDFVPDNLSSDGKGRNYGLEVSAEKKFANKLYFLAGGSWYQSEFSDGDSDYYTARYNGNFTSNFSGGKEWSKRHKTFGIHTRVLYLGGLRQPFIDEVQSQMNGTTVYSNPNEFAVQLPNYFRIDLRASWRKNKPGYTRTISIDIQNLSGQQNLAYRYYDTHLQKVEKKNQLGLIPVVVYRIDF